MLRSLHARFLVTATLAALGLAGRQRRRPLAAAPGTRAAPADGSGRVAKPEEEDAVFSATRPFWSAVTYCLFMASMASTASLAQPARAGDRVVLLNQGWSEEDRLRYYYTSQGSAVFPYDWFLNLEEAGSTDLFRSDRVAASFGLIPHPADPKYNPDGLPIGIARTRVPDGRWKGEWVGLTCAACHTGELRYQGAKVRIDGGVSTGFDFSAFLPALDDALAATAANPDKFDRFAAQLNRRDPEARAELRTQLSAAVAEVHYYRRRTALAPFPFGPGRMDALGSIHNRLADNSMQTPENWVAGLAPTRFPFLWNAPQSSWVQWTGVIAMPLRRNANESMGVFIKLDLASRTPEEGLFDSTMDLKGQIEIEQLLRRLAPPKWPEDVLGPIDRQKAADGARLFAQNCAKCHSTWPHRWSEPKLKGKRFIENALVPREVVGTDPMQFKAPQFNPDPASITGALGPYLKPPFTGAVLAPWPVISEVATWGAIDKALSRLGLTEEQIEDAKGFRLLTEKTPRPPVYKAGPREGVWAVGPFLHNGSVPNLYELLTPGKDRPKQFFVGREFDPVKVGVDTSGNSGRFLLNTTLPGNSNQGHSFEDGPMGPGVIGRLLTDDERWALIEYLKSIPTEAGQVTPYGGPKDPIEAWKDPTFLHNVRDTGYHGN